MDPPELAQETSGPSEEPASSWPHFIAKTPPDAPVKIQVGQVWQLVNAKWTIGFGLNLIDVELWCDNCGGDRAFTTSGAWTIDEDKDAVVDRFLYYSCRNCVKTRRIFAVRLEYQKALKNWATVMKLGEIPPYGPTTPSRVITLIGPDRELFLKGRRSENRGLGIGAFAYYRRVVENQTQRLFAEIRAVAVKLSCSKNTLETLDKAISEKQFTRAVELVKDAIPERLLISGQNPLTLLHDALSTEMHAGTDEEALAVARSIREVLTELASRMSDVLQERSELDQAVATLLAKRSAKNKDK